jgi:LysR family transcriptional regulator, hypochlorite-specific transcription factor HypT
MDIQDALDFIALATSRSFSKAAAQRHVTQPAFSRRVRALELGLKLDLVDRSRTPLALTPAGEQFLRHAQGLVKVYDQATRDMQALVTNMPDAVHVQTGRSMANVYFPSWYKQMQTRVKGLTMRLSHAQGTVRCLNDLRAGLTDLVIQLMVDKVKRNDDYDGLLQTVIGTERLLFVRAPDAPENALMMYRPGSYMNALTEALLAKHPKQLKVVFESPATEFARGMVLAGYGTALLPEALVAAELKSGALVPALPSIKPIPATIVLVRAVHSLSKQAEAVWKAAN